MKRVTRQSYVINFVTRLLVILGLVGIPTKSWAQEQTTPQPKIQIETSYPLLLSSAWLRVGPSAQNFDLHQYLL